MPLSAAAEHVGPWEKFVVVTGRRGTSEVMLRSLATRLYVSAPELDGRTGALIAGAKEPTQSEIFLRVGSRDDASFRAANMRYVTAPLADGRPEPMIARAAEIGSWERFALEPVLP